MRLRGVNVLTKHKNVTEEANVVFPTIHNPNKMFSLLMYDEA